MKKTTWKKCMMLPAAMVLCLLTVFFTGSVKTEAAARKAKVVLEFTDGTKKTWETGDRKLKPGKKKLKYIYFGEYPQTEVKGKKLTKAIKNAKYDRNGIATVDGVKYKRIKKEDTTHSFDSSEEGYTSDYYYDWAGKTYAYFRYEPIKWRVLSSKNGTAFLLSEYGLDDQRYNSKRIDITWADCTLRSWLNSDFLNSSFNAKEKKLIRTTSLKNKDNVYCKTAGGNATKDKIYLLSLDDMTNTKYGFSSYVSKFDINRRCSSTDFAKAMGTFIANYEEEPECLTREKQWTSWWWGRSPGSSSAFAVCVIEDGSIFYDSNIAVTKDKAVRPVLRLNLTSVIG